MTDIIERLRVAATNGLDPSPFDTLAHEAADTIEALTAERDALRKACKHYDAALEAAFPMGASGQSWEQWNEARKMWEYWNAGPK